MADTSTPHTTLQVCFLCGRVRPWQAHTGVDYGPACGCEAVRAWWRERWTAESGEGSHA